ncbi:MAG: uracil-DNA glycosylase [Pseudomonadota bacterium]
MRVTYPQYFAGPVASFGDPAAPLLVVGLAPGLHGANATGRPFTGDHAGVLLYATLHRFGFASRQTSRAADDGLKLRACRITNAVRCVPPANKPVADEVNNCRPFLREELDRVPATGVVLALGGVAHKAILAALGLRQAAFVFGHGAEHALPGGPRLLDSYHCSRYNTQTGRLTPAMFHRVFARARRLLEEQAG